MRRALAPAGDSGNGSAWEEHLDVAFVAANGLILLTTSAVGIAANVFVVLAVYRQKSLQTSNNALVVNLAVADLLRCLIDCPILLTVVVSVHQRGNADGLVCDSQVVSFSFGCCVQLLTLACISAERHQAIAQPFKAAQRKRRIMVLVPLTWTLAVLVAALCLAYLRDSPVHVRCRGRPRGKAPSYDNFGLYMLFPLWAACFGVIIGFYARIFALVKSHNRKIFDKGTVLSQRDAAEDKLKKEETSLAEKAKVEENLTLRVNVAPAKAQPNSSSMKNSSTSLQGSARPPQCVSINTESRNQPAYAAQISDSEQPRPRAEEKPFTAEKSLACASNGNAASDVENSTANTQKVSGGFGGEQAQARLRADKETKDAGHRVPSPAPALASTLPTEPRRDDGKGGQAPPVTTAPDQVAPSPPDKDPEAAAAKPPAESEGAVCMMPSKAGKERASKKKESKMAKRAGYIIVTFLLFWLPLITTILANAVAHRNNHAQLLIIEDMEILSVSVACITSLSDPIIYAAVNPQFRSEFYRLRTRVKSIFTKKT